MGIYARKQLKKILAFYVNRPYTKTVVEQSGLKSLKRKVKWGRGEGT